MSDVPRKLQLAGCTIDFAAHVARWPDGDRSLTPTETKLLAHLVSKDGAVVSQRELLREVWEYRGGVISRTVKTTMGRLRAKVERDASRPDHLLTIVGAGYRFEAGDPRPEEVTMGEVAAPVDVPIKSDLPAADGALVGRDRELDRVLELLAATDALVTLTGSAGSGKTRLALEVGHRLADDGRAREIRLVALAGATSENDIVAAVASALGLELTAAGDRPADVLGGALRGRPGLVLVLDNLEQALLPAGAVVTALRAARSGVRLLATSQAPLAVAGEAVVSLAPLDAAAAARLFRDRAGAAALPPYADDDALAPVLARLDGLPLAVELAAGWSSFLGPDDLAGRLAHQLDLLQSARADRPARHGSLRAAIASSWELLDEGERTALTQLSVFVGAAPLDAVDAVLDLGGQPTLPVIRRLCDRSLARQVPPPGGGPGSPWLRLFEAVRQFAAEQAGDAAPAAETRHGEWFRWLGDADALDALEARGTSAGLHEVVGVRAELVLACRRALDRGDAVVASGTLEALLAVARFRGPILGYRDLLQRTLALPGLEDEARAFLLLAGAEGEMRAGRWTSALSTLDRVDPWPGAGAVLEATLQCGRARALVHSDLKAAVDAGRAAVEAATDADDPTLRGRCHLALGAALRSAGETKACRSVLETALDLAKASRDLRTEAGALNELGRLAFVRGRPARSLSLLEGALAAARELGDRPLEAELLDAVAALQAVHNRVDEAQDQLLRALELRRELGDRGGEGVSSVNLGAMRVEHGDFAGARAPLDAALAIALEVRHTRLEAAARGSLGELFVAEGRHGDAGRQLTRALELAAELGSPRMRGVFLRTRGELEFADGRSDEARATMAAAQRVFTDAALRSDCHDLLLRWSEREGDLGNHDRADELHHDALKEAELSVADGPASRLGR